MWREHEEPRPDGQERTVQSGAGTAASVQRPPSPSGSCASGGLRGRGAAGGGSPHYSRSPTHWPFLEEGSDALSVFRFAAEIAAPKDEVPGRPVSPGPCVCNFRGGPSLGLCVHIHTLLRHLVPASVCIKISQELSFVLCRILAILELSVP